MRNTEVNQVPTPITILRGYLRLCGFSWTDIDRIINLAIERNKGILPSLGLLLDIAKNSCFISYSKKTIENLETLLFYKEYREQARTKTPIILIIQGASATGKSVMTFQMMQNLGATRVIGTDTIRQLLRTIRTKDEVPELFTHTYQAYQYRQSGDEKLDRIIRGFLAQTELIEPTVRDFISRLEREGTEAIVEGVHLSPGNYRKIGKGILEVVLDPISSFHQAMFLNKGTSGLRTVSEDLSRREEEYENTRLIQEYIIKQAKSKKISTVRFQDFQRLEIEINELIIKKMKELVIVNE